LDSNSQYNQPINGGIPMPGGGSLKDQLSGLGALAPMVGQSPASYSGLQQPGTTSVGINPNNTASINPAPAPTSTPTSQATTMSSSGTPAGTTVQNVTTNTSNLPAYAQPYFTDLMQRGQALSNQSYTPYPDQRVAGFSDLQNQAQNQAGNLNTPNQFGTATNIAQQAGLGALAAGQNFQNGQFSAQNVSGPRLNNYQMNGPQNVTSDPNLAGNAAQMTAAQMGYNPQSFNEDGTAQKYMSPYIQNVIDRQKEQATRDAQISQLTGDLGAARQGTYGGARQLLAATERERNLGNTQANITASGLQSAYQNAQQQFNAEQQSKYQTAFANMNAQQQAAVQNQAAKLQMQGMSAQQAMQAALANQQAGLTTGQANLNANLGVQTLGANTGMQAQLANQQYDMEAQKAAEQSKQFGSSLGLQGLSQANTAATTLANLGTTSQNAELQAIQAKNAAGASQQALQQQYLDTNYADFLRQRDYPQELLNNYSAILHGVPVTPSSTATTYAPPPSLISQIGGAGIGALGLSKLI